MGHSITYSTNKCHLKPMIRGVHRSGPVNFRPSPNPTRWCRVERRVTRNRPSASICRVGFGFRWRSSMFDQFRVIVWVAKSSSEFAKSSLENVKTQQICIKITEICTKIVEICWEWPDLAKSHQIWLRTRWISSDLSWFRQICI